MILTEHNRSATLSDRNPNLHATVLDYSDGIDFVCRPVLFLERCRSPRATVDIGGHITVLPLAWKILVGDREYGQAELITVEEAINNRHSVVALNPHAMSLPQCLPIKFLAKASTHVAPKIGKKQCLAIPLTAGDRPMCFFASSFAPYTLEPFDLSDLVM